MEQLNVRIKEKVKEYPIFIGNSLLPLVKEFLEKNHKDKKPVIITDSNVKEMCKEKISDTLKGLNPAIVFIPASESSKSRQMKEKIEDSLLEKKYRVVGMIRRLSSPNINSFLQEKNLTKH